MIDLGEDRLHDLQEGEEIDHAIDLVQRAAKLNGHAVVMTVQRFKVPPGKMTKWAALKIKWSPAMRTE